MYNLEQGYVKLGKVFCLSCGSDRARLVQKIEFFEI